MGNLTDKQEAFCQAVASGKNDSDAHRLAYPASLNWKSTTVHREAHKLRRNPKMAARIEELQAEIAKRNLWTREKSVIALVGVVEEPDKKSDIIAAVKELNLMHGFNEPNKHQLIGADGRPVNSGVMLVPVVGGMDQWEQETVAQQQELKRTVRE